MYPVDLVDLISNFGYYTENISAFLEYYLNSIAQKVKSCIKGTIDSLRKLDTLPSLPEDIILCKIDVVGLYPNIPHEDGLVAMRKALDAREDKTVSADSLIELGECVLKNNIFEYNTSFYKQLRGTTIGTKIAPPYAIIFMSDLEENFLKDGHKKPLAWWRYIDDIFMLRQHGEKELEKSLEFLNCYHTTIKFTANDSREEINFLDVLVRKKNNQPVTDLCIKPTDTHQYLHASSCHVYYFKKPILYSQALALNRICSENSVLISILFYDKRCNELEVWLRERGYSDKLVRQQVLKARKHRRKDLLNGMKDKRNDFKLVLNITYHSNVSNLKDTMSFLHLLLTPDQEHQKVFHKVPIMGFQRGKGLKVILVRAKVCPV